MTIRTHLERLLHGRDLDESEAGDLLRGLCDPAVDREVKAAVLVALRLKGETAEEVRGIALAMRSMAVPVDVDGPIVDTCGTGGDGTGSLNVSTAAALVVAACGLPVAKHGNRSVSSRSGSADVLGALGVPLPADPGAAVEGLRERGFAFLYAPSFHPAMAHLGPVRRALGVRTVMNLVGPLTNPARPSHQLIGACDEGVAELLADALAGMPVERAFVVHGSGFDEATPVGPFLRFDVDGGQVTRERIDPLEYGIPRCTPEALRGGTPAENAAALRDLVAGAKGAYRDAVVLNAALALECAGKASGRAAAEQAQAALDDGAVQALLETLKTGEVARVAG